MKIGSKPSRSSQISNLSWPILFVITAFVIILLEFRGVSASTGGDTWRHLTESFTRGGEQAALDKLIIDMPFENYNNILQQREKGVAEGVVRTATFQNGNARLNGQEIPIRLQLRVGVHHHLAENEKWNFEGQTRRDQQLYGFSQFFLSDPADNDWLNEWAFGQALRQEGLLSSRIHFVQLIFNGDERGIYAVQEGFGQELLPNQNREPGVMIGFDPTSLWDSVAYFGGDTVAAFADPVTNLTAVDFRFFEVDSFRETDPLLSTQQDRAISLLRQLQRSEMAASEVFDVEKVGTFLALSDLWGATNALSLINLHYYLNPTSGKLEPIGFNTNPLANQERISLANTYNDPHIQTAYAQALQRFSQPDYLAEFQQSIETDWHNLQQSVAEEVTVTPPWESLAARQLWLQRSLQPVRPIFVNLGSPDLSMEGIIEINIANSSNLPIEILGFDINGETFLDIKREWLIDSGGKTDSGILSDPDRIVLAAYNPDRAVVQYVRFHLPLIKIIEQNEAINFNQPVEIRVQTRILGLAQTKFSVAKSGI